MTAAETFQAQYPLALEALAIHMRIHGLPAPFAIDQYGDRGGEIRIMLTGGQQAVEAWARSVAIDHTETHRGLDGWRTAWDVRLPDTGFRFTLIGYHPQSIRLTEQVPA